MADSIVAAFSHAALAGSGGWLDYAITVQRGESLLTAYSRFGIQLDTKSGDAAAIRPQLEGDALAVELEMLAGDRPFAPPPHLYMNFSGVPGHMTFDEYSVWYDEHQRENIAHCSVLERGWRYRALDVPAGEGAPEDLHVAFYELSGPGSQMREELAAALRSGAISIPDWFRRFGGIEAVAVEA